MRNWLLLFFVGLPLLLFAQEDFNALKQELKTASEDRKVEILCKLSDSNIQSSPKLALDYAQLALDLARKNKDAKDEAYVLGKIGALYYQANDLKNALEYDLAAVEKYQANPNVKGYSSTLDNIGRIYEDKARNRDAFDYYQRALQIKLKNGEKQGLAEIYYSLAVVAKYLAKAQTAFDYYQKGIKAEEALQEEVRQEYLVKSKTYATLGNQDKALYYYKLYSSSSDTLHVLFTKANRKKMKEMQLQFDAIKEKKESEATQLQLEKARTEKALLTEKAVTNVIGIELKKEKHITSEKEKKISILEKDKMIDKLTLEKQKTKNRSISILVFLLLIITFLFYLLYLLKARANKALKKAYAQIRIKNAEISNAYQTLDLLARRDPLTNLSNRRDILEKIKYSQVAYERNQKPFTLIMLDIDHFKNINDTYGHDAGDFVLIFISNVIKDSVRKQDYVARWGGEEFLLLLPETNANGGKIVGEKIRSSLASGSCVFQQQVIHVTLTAGVCCYADYEDLDLCLKKADKALYIGKENGRNQVVIAPDDDNQEVSNKLE